MTQSTTPKTPGVPAPMPTVWPPSNPSGTVIPFPLPWGPTGCCPPGGMDALMKCYCDIQQASAFIGQIMLDQINNNPAIIQAIIAGIEASGSSLPLIGVTNGQAPQPGQVGEFILFEQTLTIPTASTIQSVTFGVLQPGDWDCWAYASGFSASINDLRYYLTPVPAGFSDNMWAQADALAGYVSLITTTVRALISVPTLVNFTVGSNESAAGPGVATGEFAFAARRRR